MQFLDVLVLGMILFLAALALRFLCRQRGGCRGCKSCHGCDGQCSACPAAGKGEDSHADAP